MGRLGRSARMVRKIVKISLALAVALAGGVFLIKDAFREYCLIDNYVLREVTSTIQTVSRELGGNRSEWIIRGRVTKITVVDNHIIGYLSLAYVEEDGLVGLEGPNDKEGYFAIDVARGSVVLSGWSEAQLDSYIKGIAGVRVKDLEFGARPSLIERIRCRVAKRQ